MSDKKLNVIGTIWKSNKSGELITVIGYLSIPELKSKGIAIMSQTKGTAAYSIDKFFELYSPHKITQT